jgi:hypothetical protein
MSTAENGAAPIAYARQETHRLRSALRRADRALAAAAEGKVIGSIVFDAGSFDQETEDSVVAMLEAACDDHPGSSIEITVVAHPGADERSRT